MKDLLERLLKRFNEDVKENPDSMHGLCVLVHEIYNVNSNPTAEHTMFLDYLEESHKDQKVYYLWHGGETKSKSFTFHWPPYDIEPRREWLETEIRKLSNNE